jgi:cell wall-associated NlpC family hydrolase
MLFRIAPILFIIFGCGAGPPQPAKPGFDDSRSQRLVFVANEYIGSPYRYGGKNSGGFDCSGLVHRIYHDALGIKTPRTVRALYSKSYAIGYGDVRPGDLVFFRTKSSRVDHVGMMIARGKFVHASKSRGVIISWLGEKYYRQRLDSIRRYK